MRNDYTIQSRYLVKGEGWKLDEETFTGDYVHAGERASEIARELDKQFGDDHFWTVDLKSSTYPYGSYFQLFHGRLE